jgi:hypothetical protein
VRVPGMTASESIDRACLEWPRSCSVQLPFAREYQCGSRLVPRVGVDDQVRGNAVPPLPSPMENGSAFLEVVDERSWQSSFGIWRDWGILCFV